MAEPALRMTDEDGKRKPYRKKLTQSWCRNVKPPTAGRFVAHDTQTPGLVLVVTAKGHRSFYLYKKVYGRPKRIKLADADVALDDVRKKAVKTLADLHAGKDPVAERRRRRQRVETLGELWERYGEEKDRTPRTVTAEASLWKHVGHLKGRALDAIQPEDVAALHRRVAKDAGKVSANRVVQIIRRLYRWAYRQHIYRGTNPAEGLNLNPEHARERYVMPAELPALLEAIDKQEEPFPDYFRLLLLTGARRSALASMKWADVDLDAMTWTIPREDSKNKAAVTVALVPEAIEIIRQRHEQAKRDDDGELVSHYVFPGHGKAGHLHNPYAAWKRIRKDAGITDITMHDLRRTTGSYLAAAGVSLPIIGKALGHKSQSSTAIYSRLDVSDVREQLRHVSAAMQAAQPAKDDADAAGAGENSEGQGDD